MEFAGSLTLRHETFVSVCAESLDAARRHGFRNFLVLNAHGGNQGACQVLLERFGADHPDCQIAVATWWRSASEALGALNETGPGGVGHACEFETSLMLLIAPHLVRMEAIPVRSNAPTFDWAEGDLLRAPRVALFRTMKQMTPHGAYGDPSKASAAKGQQIAEIVCNALSIVVRDLTK
jgi:creatinine amidohydrolase